MPKARPKKSLKSCSHGGGISFIDVSQELYDKILWC